jgi:hypothetical protein
MNSLSELNSFGQTTLDYTDNRTSIVKFDRVSPIIPLDITNQIANQVVTVNPGIEIVEIVNYNLANVRYRVTIVAAGSPLLTGSTISFAGLPSGVTLSQAGNVYTLSGINSVAIWNAIKTFTWYLPSNYDSADLWYLDVAVLYYDSARDEEMVVDWEVYDPDHYYIARISSSASLNCIPTAPVILFGANFSSGFGVTCVSQEITSSPCDMTSSFTLVGEGHIQVDNLFTSALMTVAGTYGPGRLKANLTSRATLTCSLNPLLTNMISPREYYSDNGIYIFYDDTPQIGDGDMSTTATFTITLSSSLGKFSSDQFSEPVSPWTYSGTLTSVNAIFENILFYPNKGVSSNGTFSYTQAKSGTTQLTRTINLTGNVLGFIERRYTFVNAGNTAWQPTNDELLYSSNADILLVGGGGGGSYSAGGGGGGVREALAQTLTRQVYIVNVGAGGSPTPAQGSIGFTPQKAGDGSSTTAFSLTATGGTGAYDNGYSGNTGVGGTSGIPAYDATTSYSGGGGWNTSGGAVGGGGGGAGGPGLGGITPSSAQNKPSGGVGKLSTITGLFYGGGGGGAYGQTTAERGRGGNAGITRTAKSTTAFSGATIDTTTKKYGAGSLNFNGSGYIRSNDLSEDFNFTSRSLTIESWVRRSRTVTENLFAFNPGRVGSGTPTLRFTVIDSVHYLQFIISSAVISYTITPSQWTSIWRHVCVQFNDDVNTWYLYVDGVQVGSYNQGPANNGQNSRILVGSDSLTNNKFQGNIDDFRVTKSLVYRVAGFTAPTTELVNLTNTVFLLNGNASIQDDVANLQNDAGGGGGFGYESSGPVQTSGTPNTGGGGGGGWQYSLYAEGAGSGANGVVVVEFNA